MLPEKYPHKEVEQREKTEKRRFPHLLAVKIHQLEATGEVRHPTPKNKEEDKKRIMKKFPKVFDGECRPMNGPPCHFVLKDGAILVAMRGSRPFAVPLMPKLKEERDTLEEQGIIEQVTKPTAWVHPIVLVPKKKDSIRLCVDFRNLNKSIIRPTFETITPFQAVRTIPPGMKFFTVGDALKGYHQVPLVEESADLTTFSTPMGRYRYRRLPFGITHAGDDYCRRIADVFDSIPNSRRIVEDIWYFQIHTASMSSWSKH